MSRTKNLLIKQYDILDFNICLNDVEMSIKKFKRRWNGDFVVTFEIKKEKLYDNEEY